MATNNRKRKREQRFIRAGVNAVAHESAMLAARDELAAVVRERDGLRRDIERMQWEAEQEKQRAAEKIAEAERAIAESTNLRDVVSKKESELKWLATEHSRIERELNELRTEFEDAEKLRRRLARVQAEKAELQTWLHRTKRYAQNVEKALSMKERLRAAAEVQVSEAVAEAAAEIEDLAGTRV